MRGLIFLALLEIQAAARLSMDQSSYYRWIDYGFTRYYSPYRVHK